MESEERRDRGWMMIERGQRKGISSVSSLQCQEVFPGEKVRLVLGFGIEEEMEGLLQARP
jgi:hypothetical protein